MVKLLQKMFVLAISLYAVLVVLLSFSPYGFGVNLNSSHHIFQSIVPDSYSCPSGCNTCSFDIYKFGLFYGGINASCTLLGCPSSSYKKEHKLCKEDWKKSQRLDYANLPKFTNYCLNDYRNITYLEQQKETNPKFTLADSQSSIHTRRAISEGIAGCTNVYNRLKQENRFSDEELLKLGAYLRIRRRLDSNYRLTHNLFKEDIIIIKEIFNYLEIDRDRFKDIISDTMLQQFQEEYDLVVNSPTEEIESPDIF
ncbi:MAG: hypothetical protein AAFY63_02755 [Cyanobacteria bacterium J06643_13]